MNVLSNAFNGVNLIPTILIILVLLYWLTVIIGVIDFDFLDLDIDLDMDGVDDFDAFHSLLVFFNIKDIPFMIVFSILALLFWVLSMLLYLLPIPAGGWINGLLLIPVFVVSLLLTKLITNPLKGFFKNAFTEAESQDVAIIGQIVTVVCDLKGGRLGQAEVKRDGASILVNVKPEFEHVEFSKQEEALVTKKDDKDIYYIVKLYEH